jgi:CRISPR/Cas system-associated exonuclease Cas4 (RecB family)
MKPISKSLFLQYLICPKDAWFRLHQPDLEEFNVSFSDQNVMAQGNVVEDCAKKLKIFSGFVEVKSRAFSASKEIDKLIAEEVPAIYQPTFSVDGFIIRCDFLVWNAKTKKWDLYEVKGTNSKKDDDGPRDHISDLAFQTIVLERYGLSIGSKYIVHLNKEYVRGKELDVEELFVINDSTEQVELKKATTDAQMEKAKAYLNQEDEPKDGCNCHLLGRSNHCETFKKSHPEIPDYSVHDISRIGSTPDKLIQLVKNGIYHLHEAEDISDFTIPQQNQIQAHKTKKEIIVREEIANILDNYTYPLYFFDYETFAPAVPIYEGFSSYQRIPIQFSLHIIEKMAGPVRHLDYLHLENTDPSETVAKMLGEVIDPKGTVLAWNVSFEKGVTSEIAERLPKYEPVITRICGQMRDLRDIFSQQHYVHKDFKGKTSIEAVMNVLLPDMTYDHLPYTGSDVGFVWWNDIVNQGKEPSEREEKIHLIREYCKQDTFVMVEIFRILNSII